MTNKMTTEKWYAKSDGKGAFMACFQIIGKDGNIDEGVARSGLTEAEALFHVERAIRSNELRDRNLALCNHLFNEENWKLETKREFIADIGQAERVCDAIGFFCGGSEMTIVPNGTGYEVGSRGYYWYCGA
jgi:hypothetical protein